MTIDSNRATQTLYCDDCGTIFRAPPADVGGDCAVCDDGALHRTA